MPGCRPGIRARILRSGNMKPAEGVDVGKIVHVDAFGYRTEMHGVVWLCTSLSGPLVALRFRETGVEDAKWTGDMVRTERLGISDSILEPIDEPDPELEMDLAHSPIPVDVVLP